MERVVQLHPDLPPVCRLGLASRGNTGLPAPAALDAFHRGIHYFNWAGEQDGMRDAIRHLVAAGRRDELVVAAQIAAVTAADLERELAATLAALTLDRLDVLTFYYVQSADEWQSIRTQGAYAAAQQAQSAGRIGLIGLTSHQRPLAAAIARDGETELLMIRYNAAHRGAESEIFPVTQPRRLPVIAYTCLRWGALIRPLPGDAQSPTAAAPPPPTPVDCYRFALSHPAVSIALMAPDTPAELAENLRLLDDWRACTPAEMERLRAHGDQVKATAGGFP